MKKIYLLMALILTILKAQAPDTSTVKKLLHYIMQPLDKSQVPSGFLEEYGCPILPMATFNGTLTDSNRVVLILYAFASLELIAEEIENPFGTDANDLPIDSICINIKKHVNEIFN